MPTGLLYVLQDREQATAFINTFNGGGGYPMAVSRSNIRHSGGASLHPGGRPHCAALQHQPPITVVALRFTLMVGHAVLSYDARRVQPPVTMGALRLTLVVDLHCDVLRR